ncbi:putative glycolipid-binding domain-containing protein [Lutimaribacter marinistellae]|uniref:Glycolipid-binding domain-containing protein n=1 Tax=Lutimaribacter marinistellae TaxID=1820329 RepID=A0ABV7TBP2_9RHOB
MTGKVLAEARWRRLDGPGEDKCRLIEEPGGFMLTGHARFGVGGSEAALDYIVRCDRDWRTTSADVAGFFHEEEAAWRIKRDSDGWMLNEKPSGLAECVDIDLAMTPATNLLPIRRLSIAKGCRAEVTAAWFRPDEGGRLDPLVQSYSCLTSEHVHYASFGFQAVLHIHPSGFVTEYEGLWEGEVNDQSAG